jgi:hypothetical protein
MSTRAPISALMITLGLATGLTGCGAQSADRPTARATAVTTRSTPSTSTSTVTKARTAPEPSTITVPKQRFVCPLGGIKEAIELQRAVDQGHQPWRLSPTDVATACTFPDGEVDALGGNTYRVTRVSTGQTVIVEEAQPVRPGPGGIWVVTKVTPR